MKSAWPDNCSCWLLRWREGAMSQGKQAASKNEKGKKLILFLQSPERTPTRSWPSEVLADGDL